MAFRPAGKGGIFPVGFVVTHLTWLGLRLLQYYIPDRVEWEWPAQWCYSCLVLACAYGVVPISIFSANPTGAPLVTRPPGLGGGQPRCTPSIVVMCVCTNLGSLSAALQGQLDGAAQQQQLSWGRSGAAQRHQQQPGRLGSSSAGAGRRGSSAAAARGQVGGAALQQQCGLYPAVLEKKFHGSALLL